MKVEGWVCVPVKYTNEMYEAAYTESDAWRDRSDGGCIVATCQAWVAAAPTPSPVPVDADELEGLRRIEKAAQTYYSRYAQDEASDVEDCVCGREQHEAAIELRDALAANGEKP